MFRAIILNLVPKRIKHLPYNILEENRGYRIIFCKIIFKALPSNNLTFLSCSLGRTNCISFATISFEVTTQSIQFSSAHPTPAELPRPSHNVLKKCSVGWLGFFVFICFFFFFVSPHSNLLLHKNKIGLKKSS